MQPHKWKIRYNTPRAKFTTLHTLTYALFIHLISRIVATFRRIRDPLKLVINSHENGEKVDQKRMEKGTPS